MVVTGIKNTPRFCLGPIFGFPMEKLTMKGRTLFLRDDLDPHFWIPRLKIQMFLSSSQDLATPEAFSRNPSRVWEFYQYRRDVALNKKPNAAHLAIAECEARLRKQGRSVVVITQCIDDLHHQAGSKHVLRVHGETQTGRLFHPTQIWSNTSSLNDMEEMISHPKIR